MTHWHRLGERCSCGHLSVPARFYADGATQEQAEAAYLGFLKENMPERWAKLTKSTVPSRPITSKHKNLDEVRAVLRVTKKCVTCNTEYAGRGKECGRCRTKRSRAKR